MFLNTGGGVFDCIVFLLVTGVIQLAGEACNSGEDNKEFTTAAESPVKNVSYGYGQSSLGGLARLSGRLPERHLV